MACPNKQVQIYKFWINGDCDVGAYGEHALRLDGKKYFPNSSHDCPMDPYGYCEWREGQAHDIGGTSRWIPIDGYKSLTVGTESMTVLARMIASREKLLQTSGILIPASLTRSGLLEISRRRQQGNCVGLPVHRFQEKKRTYRVVWRVAVNESFIWYLKVKAV